MLILGIDPGLRITGYGLVSLTRGRPLMQEAGVLRMKSKGDLATRLAELHKHLAELIKETSPDRVAVEQLYAHYKHPRTAILMGHARGVILLAAAQKELPVTSLASTMVKRTITGNGHASKAQVQRAVAMLCKLPKPPEPPDVADAHRHRLDAGLANRPPHRAGVTNLPDYPAAVDRTPSAPLSLGLLIEGSPMTTEMDAERLSSAQVAAHKEAAAVKNVPDAHGHFGPYGGSYVPETLMVAVRQLADEYERAKKDPKFTEQLKYYLKQFVGRPTPLYYAERLTQLAGGAKIFLKREDLAHTGAHKINNTIGQALLTLRMGKKRVIAETGAGQHGVGTATAAAVFGLKCDVYMGSEDIRRQNLNVFRMKLMGARVIPVESGLKTLKDALNEALRDWMGSVEHTHYIIGTVAGPHPFPMIVRDFQAIIGTETRGQCLDQFGRLPDAIVACVGGGSNAAGIFYPFIEDTSVKLYGVEAGGKGSALGQHAASLSMGHPGVLHGTLTYVLQNADGQTADVHSVSAGLDYPGVGPEHAYWKDAGRVTYESINDQQALDAFQVVSQREGIIPALESAHAVAYALQLASRMAKDQVLVINLSGRGDKDCMEVARLLDQK